MVQDGQIVLLRAPHTDRGPGKIRPALVIRRLPGRHDDWLISPISSNLSQEISGFDEVVSEKDDDFKLSGLKHTSLIRIARLAAVEQGLFLGSIGRLSSDRLANVKQRLARWIQESPPS